MNDNEIVNALECLCGIETPCKDCVGHRFPYPVCKQQVAKDARDIINSQKAEIKRIEALVKEIYSLNKELIDDVNNKSKYIYELEDKLKAEKADVMYFKDQIRAEAIKKFAERLKEYVFDCDVSFGYGKEHCEEAVTVLEIDRIVKEMTEETP